MYKVIESRIASEADAIEAMGQLYGQEVEMVVLPVEQLDPGFFDLSTGIAGAVTQKFLNYGFRLAIVGDIERFTAASEALAAYVRESNRGRQVWFLSDVDALEARLRPAA
ncbi:hypothetical protein GCM10017786_29150 [Amycolatopsis deserti]|uniref:DUF4180 domain-containing protein n=1 Tax=Amycolatopsis deserti TaxID=185696 RepID=A0ABQ3IVT9_9PSEU|nr:DUF4180 domain-containing protein [Amycolatopsis deserti]GHE94294.1 hypothetical protein GCM10017786_29150 [Amycolatopsis deserti]